MGLCKCERKKVTNLFCFEHRVNVCEFCLISHHPRCIVKSYLYWLKESDYSSICTLCSKPLDDESIGECVRLMCLDIFHWQCLDKYASELPSTTAPAGYECPLCSQSIIPLSNQGGPLAEALRTKLSTAKWMKPNFQIKSAVPRTKAKPTMHTENEAVNNIGNGKLLDSTLDIYAEHFLSGDVPSLPEPPTNSTRPVTVPIEPVMKVEAAVESRFERQRHRDDSIDGTQTSASLLRPPRLLTADEDDKYRRRTQAGTLNQFLDLPCRPQSLLSFPRFRRRRFIWIFGALAVILFVFILLFHALGGPSLSGDPLLDPMMNPDIHVAPAISHKAPGARQLPLNPPAL